MKSAGKRIRLPILGACLVMLLGGLFLSAQESGTGRLLLKVKPGAAGVFVDGKYVGPASDDLFFRWYRLTAGEHEITLSDPRYQDFSTLVNIVAGKKTTLSQSLQAVTVASPPFGTLQIQGRNSRFLGVFVNGKFMGHLDEFDNFVQGLLLNPGEYTLKVVSPEGNQVLQEEKIKIEKNKTTRVRVGSAE